MSTIAPLNFSRLFGSEAVLARLTHLGRAPRTFANLVQAGFPGEQLDEARRDYARQAATPVERYAAERMRAGFFEDESLLQVLCRSFQCTDWHLEQSPWFFSREDYLRFYGALLSPAEFHIALLERGGGEQRWGGYFLKLPFVLGMEQAKAALWRETCEREHYWLPQADYGHVRAAQMFGYLQRRVNPVRFSKDDFNYHWELGFRRRFAAALALFEETLERAVRRWEEQRRERTRGRFRARTFRSDGAPVFTLDLLRAFAYLGLEPEAATPEALKQAFRRRSKETHPDQGGSPEDFKRLAACRELIESWLLRRPAT